jgi:hypothetical protein
MANSYKLYTGDNATKIFALSGIDGWVSTTFLKVYVNDILQTTGYSFINMSTTPQVEFITAPATGAVIRIQRETARSSVSGDLTLSAFKSNIIDFNDGSILTSGDLDKAVEGLVHVSQESNDSGSGALGLNATQTAWTAGSKRITNVTDGTAAQDAVTVNQFNLATLFGGSAMQPELWSLTGTGTATYTLSPAPSGLNEDLFFVTIDGVVQPPSSYTLTATTIVFSAVVAAPKLISIRNLGVARSLVSSVQTAMIVDANVTTAKLDAFAVTNAKLDTNSVTTAKIVDANVTYAKVQNVNPNKLLGRVSATAGVIEEVTCTPLAQTFLTKTTATDQRTALELGALAIKATVASGDIDASSVTYAKMQTVAANKVLGSAAGGAVSELDCTAYGRTLLNTADAAGLRSGLSVDPIYELRTYTTAGNADTNTININLGTGGAYNTLYQEYILFCNYSTSASPPVSNKQVLTFTGLTDYTRKFLVSFSKISTDANGNKLARPENITVETRILDNNSSSGISTFPSSGTITLLPIPLVERQVPELWSVTGVLSQTAYTLSGMLTNSTDIKDFFVTVDGVARANNYTISANTITFSAPLPTAGQAIVVRTYGANKTTTWVLQGSSFVYTNVIRIQRIV